MYSDRGRIYTYSYLRDDQNVDPKPKMFAREAAQVVASRNKLKEQSKNEPPPRPKSGMQTLVERLHTTPTRPKSRNELLARTELFIPSKPLEKGRWTSTYAELNREETVNDEKDDVTIKQVSNGVGRIYSRNEPKPKPAPRAQNVDPRSASRAPSAKKDILSNFRFDNSAKASPSRDFDRSKPWEEDMQFDGSSAFVGTTGKTSYVNLPANYDATRDYSRMSTPKSCYFIKPLAVTQPQPTYLRSPSPFSKSSKTQSELGFASDTASEGDSRSDVQQIEEAPVPPSTNQPNQYEISYSINQNYRPPSSQKSTALGFTGYNRAYYRNHFGKSMPNVNLISAMDPIPIYPYHLLVTTNYRLPRDVDRCGLEKHLSNEEFIAIFNMTRPDFYRMAEWRRNQLKKRFRLF